MMKLRIAAPIILLALTPVMSAVGQAGRRAVGEGNRLFAEGRFDEARQQYLEAVRAAPESPVARFNAASALYRTEDFQNARVEFQQALELGDPALQAQAWYNLGNALYREQALEESREAFKQALRVDPGDIDAKHNLERVLEQMQQPEQQQQQDQDEQNQDQQNQDQQNQGQPQPQQQGEDGEQDEQNQPDDPSDDGDEQENPQDGGPPPQMTPEEIERLLQAVNEDPNELRRQAARKARPVKVKKDW